MFVQAGRASTEDVGADVSIIVKVWFWLAVMLTIRGLFTKADVE